jgi:hypothetical protein
MAVIEDRPQNFSAAKIRFAFYTEAKNYVAPFLALTKKLALAFALWRWMLAAIGLTSNPSISAA